MQRTIVFPLLLAVLIAFPAGYGQETEKERFPLPKGLSPEERALLPEYRAPGLGPLPPPPRPVRAMAEFEELEGIIVRWAYGTSNLLLSQIVDAAQDEGTVWVLVRPGTSDSVNIKSYLAGRGIPLTNIEFLGIGTNSIWSRDYGPWTAYDTVTDSLALVDFRYNRPRPQDDLVPAGLSAHWGVPLYSATSMPDSLVFTGGNFMVDGFGTGFASLLIEDENPHLTGSGIDSILGRYCGLTRFVKMQTLLYDDIHHIDMHMKLLDEETLLIGEYPPGMGDHERIENTVAYLRTLQTCHGRPYRIIRIPMPPDGAGRYPPQSDYLTYTNSLIVNRTVLVPVYGLPQDAAALQIYRDAMPGYRVLGFDCSSIIPSNGAIHCITKEVGVREPVLIAHRRWWDTPDTLAAYRVETTVRSRGSVDSVLLLWRSDTTQAFRRVVLEDSGGVHVGSIPRQRPGTDVWYYLAVRTGSGRVVTKPLVGEEGAFMFRIDSGGSSASVTADLREGWNLVSVPVGVENDSVRSVFPGALSGAFRFEPGAGYRSEARMSRGMGYWVKFGAAQTATITGLPRLEDSLAVEAGWNLVGSISVPVAAQDVVSVPGGILASGFYSYDGTYATVDTLRAGGAYWVKAAQPGHIVLSSYPGVR